MSINSDNQENKFTVYNGKSSNPNYYHGSEAQHKLIIECEETILCSLMVDSKEQHNMSLVLGIIQSEDFFTNSNRIILDACIKLATTGQKVNPKSLMDYLINEGCFASIGGKEKIHKILSLVPFITNLETVCKVLFTKSFRRKLEIETKDFEIAAKKDFNKQPEEIITEIENRILKLKNSVTKVKKQNKISSSWSELSLQFASDLADKWDGTKVTTNYKSGLYDLDNAIAGFQPGDFLMFAGPSGIGKTIFGCALLYMFGKQGIPSLFLSGEMPEEQIVGRIKSCHTGIDSRLLTREQEKLTKQQIDYVFDCAGDTSDYPMAIKSCGAGINEINRRINEAKIEAVESNMQNFDGNFKILFLDYLQLLSGGEDSSDNRSSEIDELAKWCKQYAIENDCVVIAMAQINDSVLDRSGNRIPTINDIGWCRTAKNHVDCLGFLWSEYYNTVKTANELPALPDQEILEIYIRKSRHTAPLGMIPTLITRSQCRINSVTRRQP